MTEIATDITRRVTNEYNWGFTGTRHGMTDAQKETLRDWLKESSGHFHHGDCLGSDSDAHDIADGAGYGIVVHPPSDYRLRAWREVPMHMMRRELPYTIRNKQIVDESTALIATPAEFEEQARGGTWSTIRYARRHGKAVVLIFPDGRIKQENRRS